MGIPIKMINLVREEPLLPAQVAVQSLADLILTRYGSTVQAILFYGSCLRSGDVKDRVVDLYVVVESYHSAYGKRTHAFLNRLLPPNVFYLELPFAGSLVRAKYAVISLSDFQRGTSMRWFQSYLWGRFAQASALLYARTPQIAEQVQESLAQAVVTFLTRVIPALSEKFTAQDLWCKGLGLSYGTELRAERPGKLRHIFDTSRDYYERLTQVAVAAVPLGVEPVAHTHPTRYRVSISKGTRCRSRIGWALRGLQGKVLSVLRLLKGLYTFRGGVDYILWKIERHSGIRVEEADRLRQYPLGVFVLVWRLYRLGAFR